MLRQKGAMNMDKKRKDSVIRATVDRAALLRGVLMLTALALLLCFGLKPSRARRRGRRTDRLRRLRPPERRV